MFLSTNLKLIREKKRYSQEMVASSIGIKRNTYNNYENEAVKNPDIQVLINLSSFLNISIDTLVKVDMRKLSDYQWSELERGFDVHVSGKELRVLTKTLDSSNKENIELVPVKAQAGYTNGYADPEFIAKLPTFKLPYLSEKKSYRAFTITGDSMHPISSGSHIIGEFVQNWKELHSGQAHIILTKNEGILFKIVYSEDPYHQLRLESLNPLYATYQLPMDEVLEIWHFVTYLSSELPTAATSLESIAKDIQAIKASLNI